MNNEPRFEAWTAPSASPAFRAAVWQQIERRRPAPRWSGAWWAARCGYAGAVAASTLLWIILLHVEPPAPSSALFMTAPPGSLTAAYSQTLRGP